MKKTKVVINRKRWLRGKGSIESLLRTFKGEMCCVGFIAMQRHKASIKDILECADLECCSKEKLVSLNDTYCEMYSINDDENISDKEREKELKKYCKKAGLDITLEFVN